jgi:hypothetical protein
MRLLTISYRHHSASMSLKKWKSKRNVMPSRVGDIEWGTMAYQNLTFYLES